MNVLHVVHDEKFISFMADTFSRCGDASSLFLVRVDDASAPLVHIRDLGHMRLVEPAYFQSEQMLKDLEWCDCLVVHCLTPEGAVMVAHAPARVVVVWSAWGADYYDLVFPVIDPLLEDCTKALLRSLRSTATGAKVLAQLKRKLMRLGKHVLDERRIRRLLRRIDFFSAPIQDDYLLLQRRFGRSFRAKYAQLNYASVERTFAAGAPCSVGENILVGNSANATNNHLDVFKLLRKLDLGDRKVVCPLSYGDAHYRDTVVAYGTRLLGARFTPVMQFMPLKEYNNLIGQCGIVIMGHRRQQAVGNVCTMLYMGAKLYMNEKSPVHAFLARQGASVYGLGDLVGDARVVFRPLTSADRKRNREVLNAHWGDDVVLQNAMALLRNVAAGRA